MWFRACPANQGDYSHPEIVVDCLSLNLVDGAGQHLLKGIVRRVGQERRRLVEPRAPRFGLALHQTKQEFVE
ncbi:MAG: hypothetical protein JXM75_13035, partial [Chromatiaceae bacterium]|nr:hypothetical protein [Chromatiaceae bacterium]